MTLEVKYMSNTVLPGVALISSKMDFPGLAAAAWPHKLLAMVVWGPETGPSASILIRDGPEYWSWT